jgi:hypothetical protein
MGHPPRAAVIEGARSIPLEELEERLANCLLLLLQAEMARESGSRKPKR